jgi:PST family polysaccharide transporter
MTSVCDPVSTAVLEPGVARPTDESLHAHDLRGRAVRGAVVAGAGQATSFVLRTGSMIVMARLLFPRDFGLIGMVTAATGFMAFFHDFGLSVASIQRVTVTEEQMSTLFWVNLGAGALLATVCAVLAPVLVRFYGEPRLLPLTVILGLGFLFNGAAVQHRALLQRQMRFLAVAVVDSGSLLAGVVVGISMAASGLGYWSLAAMIIVPSIVGAAGTWIATGWIPGGPRRHTGVRSMVIFGGTVTFNSLVVYVAYNTDKMLLGRFWGPDVLGLYGRAYQLLSIPTENLNSTVSQVALPALSRLQNDPTRLATFFLRGYGLFFSVVAPITFACALFSEDIIRVFLGPRWSDAAVVFRLMSPTMLVFALINPLSWLMLMTGRTVRSLRIALVIAPTVIISYFIGLRGGARGVALGFSGAMVALALPVIMWAKHGTSVRLRSIGGEVAPPLFSIAIGALVVIAMKGYLASVQLPLARLTLETALLFAVYAVMLLFVMNRRAEYVKLLHDLRRR